MLEANDLQYKLCTDLLEGSMFLLKWPGDKGSQKGGEHCDTAAGTHTEYSLILDRLHTRVWTFAKDACFCALKDIHRQ